MSFQPVYGDHELSLRLPFERRIDDRLVAILEHSFTSEEEELPVRRGSCTRIVHAVTAAPDLQVVPPSGNQVQDATAYRRRQAH
ncbi:MAG: hypothetical protein OSA97_08720 [Nevskia sp.]|nr:hypothetical protein [Nevskia sp.]